jgi:hypothetical protein
MNSILTLTCPSCGAKTKEVIAAQGTPSGRFHCDYCGNEHILQAALASSAPPLRARVPRPESVKIEQDGQSIRIYQRWFNVSYLFMAVFCIFWDGFLIVWYGLALTTGAPVMALLFPLVHLAVGIGLTYSTLAGLFNRTVVELTSDELAIWYEPLPWPGEKTLKVRDIKQLYGQEKVSHSKKSTRYSYTLYAINHEDEQVKLVANLQSPDIVLFFEQQLETWLKIADQPVLGEIQK